MSVKRWTCTDDQCLDEDTNGNLVLYTDHLAAIQDRPSRPLRGPSRLPQGAQAMKRQERAKGR